MKISQVLELAPPTPPCFPDRLQWGEYLHTANGAKQASARPFDGAVYRPEFNFCGDCSLAHARTMGAKGKCKPDFLRPGVVVVVKVAAA